jgi:hypothetical protein
MLSPPGSKPGLSPDCDSLIDFDNGPGFSSPPEKVDQVAGPGTTFLNIQSS